MALELITGTPGSGKTLSAVTRIKQALESNPDLLVLSNIDGLQLPHESLDDFLSDVPKTFDVAYFEQYLQGRHALIVIDECQRYFSTQRRYPDSVWYFFEYHRHLGLDILLLTQSIKSLHPRLVALLETHTRYSGQRWRVGNVLRGVVYDPSTREPIGKSAVKLDKQVFSLYRSATVSQGLAMRKSQWAKFVIPAVLLTVGGLVSAPLVLGWTLGPETEPDSSIASSPSVSRPSPTLPGPRLIPNPATWRDRLNNYRIQVESGSIPSGCSVVTPDFVRCGPFPPSAADVEGSICRGSLCMVYLQRARPASGHASGDGRKLLDLDPTGT